MLTRIISALLGLPVILFFLVMRGSYLTFFIAVLALVGLYEFFKAVRNKNIVTVNFIGYITTILYFIIIFTNKSANNMSLFLAAAIILVFSYEIIVYRVGLNGILTTILGLLYIPFMISHIVYIDGLNYGEVLLWLPFLSAWYTDTFAYFVGVTIGKRKLCPKVSPQKSVEGAIGGVIGCVGLNIVTGLVINELGYNIPLLHFITIGFLCAIASELGDLAASYIKRQVGIKDFGTLIPGHGGILDRFDSIIFTAPVVYYYFLAVQGMLFN